jgi:hypothetical protein
VQRTGNGGDGEGDYQWNMRWGTASPWCAPCATLSGGKRKRRGSDTGTRAKNREPMRAPGKEGRTVPGGETSAAPRRGHVSTTRMGPATDGFRRTHSDSDPVSVAWSAGTRAMSSQVFQILQTTDGYPFLVALLFLLFLFESSLH